MNRGSVTLSVIRYPDPMLVCFRTGCCFDPRAVHLVDQYSTYRIQFSENGTTLKYVIQGALYAPGYSSEIPGTARIGIRKGRLQIYEGKVDRSGQSN